MNKKKLSLLIVEKIRNTFTVWFVIIIACSVLIHAGVELVLAHFGLLGEVDSMGKAVPSVLSSLLILPFGIAIEIFLLRYPMRPVKKLLDAMNRLAEGHYEERLEFGKVGALKELADTFNMLASELQNTEILRSDFINNFSHEFKTPIVSIHGFAELLQREELTPSQRECVDVIADESMRLANMATNVLNLTNVENLRILTKCEAYNVSEQMRKCILLLEKKWTEKDITFDAEFDEHTVSGDAELLQQVWVNLLDNAIKFSPEGGKVKVKMFSRPNALQVSICNHGPEISPQDQQRLFDKFWQGDASRASQGNGIGLSIVKTIVELHKGSVSVDSSPQKTVFTVLLPRE